ncbi:MAG: beta-carotene 15,15'-dioxygenase, Brp/Blh family [Bacteroidota bacterium]|nr:beta-carotene 15,15'-dioxygenase, Brp/Blh family [Bacteroidota bacterium]
MNAALTYLSHPWFAPSLVVLCAVLGPWMSTDSTSTWLLAGLLFVALGLPHGAVDHITYHHALGRTERSAPWRFVLPYLLGLAAFTALFLVAPTAATWAFLALAAWHFGQSHVEVRTHEVLDRVRGFALGAVLLGTLLGTQQVSSMEVLRVWLTEAQATHLLVTLEAGTAWMKLIWTVAAALAWNRAPNAKRMSIRLLREAAWVVAMWMLASSAELLWAFTAYFCLGHAADSWRAESLHHQNVTKAFWTYYSLAVPFTLTALAGLLLIGWAAYTGWIDVRWAWAVLLAGSVPHMILLDHWAPAQLRAVKA